MMSTAVGEELQNIISKALPGLPEEKKEQLLQRLLCWGVESTDDLKYVEGAPGVDLSDLLPPIQIRKLLDSFKRAGEQSQSGDVPLAIPPSSTVTLDTMSQPSLSSTVTWPESFQVPWNQMTSELRSAVANGKRPLPPDRRSMIRIIVNEMRKHEKNPSKAQCRAVALKIVKDYPKSFSDLDDTQESNEIACYSLLKQIKTRVEHVNRENTLSRRRRVSGVSDDTPIRLQCRGPTATYGCKQWQPEPPLANSDDALEEKRQTLENLYQRYGKSGADRSEICTLMKETYYLQRKHINHTQAPPIKDLKSKWPYLFVQMHIYAHFEELTGIAIHRKLNQSMQEYGKVLVDFFKSKPTNDVVKTVLSSEEDDIGPLVIKLLLAHFREEPGGLLLYADRCATADDLQVMRTIPGSPRLFVLGDSLTAGHWMLSIEGEVVCEGIQPNFLSGLATLFASYYVFNLEYQEEAACTLEFIQRRFVGINPERGTKMSKGKVPSKTTGQMVQKKQVSVNPHVATLLCKVMDFQWNF